MDINLDYADDDDPLSLKSDFILSLCELVVGGKNGLEPVEKTVIDRCVRLVYQDFLFANVRSLFSFVSCEVSNLRAVR